MLWTSFVVFQKHWKLSSVNLSGSLIARHILTCLRCVHPSTCAADELAGASAPCTRAVSLSWVDACHQWDPQQHSRCPQETQGSDVVPLLGTCCSSRQDLEGWLQQLTGLSGGAHTDLVISFVNCLFFVFVRGDNWFSYHRISFVPHSWLMILVTSFGQSTLRSLLALLAQELQMFFLSA